MSISPKAKMIIAAIGALLVAIIAIQNIGQIRLRFLFWSATVDQLFLIPLLFLCGVGVGMLLQWGIRRKPRPTRM
jgi:uncharacterized integral membrane protein